MNRRHAGPFRHLALVVATSGVLALASGQAVAVCVVDADCFDNEVCTVDHCNTTTGECEPAAIVCDDSNACTINACMPGQGCIYPPDDGAPCNDNNSCTVGDVCEAGQCAGTPIPGPPEVPNFTFSAGPPADLVWDPVAGTNVYYDVVRGVNSELAVPGIGNGPSETCLTMPSGIQATTLTDPATPQSGDPFWYMVRARDDCGVGSYGQDSFGAVRFTTVCPP